MSAKTPADFLKNIRGRPVVVKLNSGVDYRGKRKKMCWVQGNLKASHVCQKFLGERRMEYVDKQHAVGKGNVENLMHYNYATKI